MKLRVGDSYELIPWHRILAIKCTPSECMLLYRPECFGNLETIWNHLKASRDDTSLTEDRCCYDQDGNPKETCDPKIRENAQLARNAYDEFIQVYGCGEARKMVRFGRDDINYQQLFAAARQ